MVKIPDIEDFSSRRDFGVDRDVRPAVTQANISNAGAPGAALAGVGRAISGLGNDLTEIAAKQKAEQDQLNSFNDQKRLYETFGAIGQEADAAKKNIAADGTGHAEAIGKIYDTRTNAYLDTISDPKRRAQMAATIAHNRIGYVDRARSEQETQRTNYYNTEISNTATQAVESVKRNPDSYQVAINGVANLMQKANLPEQARETFFQKFDPLFIKARIEGLHNLGRHQEADALAAEADKMAGERFAPIATAAAAKGASGPTSVPGRPIDPRGPADQRDRMAQRDAAAPNSGSSGEREPSRVVTGDAKIPASIRNNNPGAQWPGPVASQFGSREHEVLNDGQGNKIARFASPEAGAAAQFALLDRSYSGMPLSAAIRKWSGGNSSSEYTASVARDIGISPDTVLTKDMLRRPEIAIPLAKAMAKIEAGRDFPMNEEQWNNAHAMFLSGGAPAGSGASGTTNPDGTPTFGTYAAYSAAVRSKLDTQQLQQQNAVRVAQKAQHDAYINHIEFGIIDGKYGLPELQQDRQDGVLTDAGEYMKLEKLIEDRQGETNILADAIDKIDGQNKTYAFDPLDKDDKKAVEAYSQAYKLGEGIGKQDPNVINRAVNVVDRTGMIPRDVVGPLQAKFRSADVGAFTFGMQAMQALYQRSPDVFAKTFGEKVTQSVATWGELAPYRSAQESFDLIKKDSDPAAAAQKEKLLKEADKAMKDAPITAADLPAIFYGNMDYEGPASKDLGPWDKDRWAGGPPMAPAQSAQLQFDYAKLYRENYALAQGDADVAKKTTIQQMQRMWGETRVHGAGGSSAWGVFGLRDRVVKYPPERFYPPLDGSYDWIKGAVEDAVKGNAGAVADWELLPVPETAADVKAGSAPRYGIMVKNDAGVWSELRDQSNQPLLIDFDPKASRRANQDKAQQDAAAAAGRQAAAGDANRDLYQPGGNPFALMPQEQVAPGPEVNAAMQRRLGPKGGVGSAKIPE